MSDCTITIANSDRERPSEGEVKIKLYQVVQQENKVKVTGQATATLIHHLTYRIFMTPLPFRSNSPNNVHMQPLSVSGSHAQCYGSRPRSEEDTLFSACTLLSVKQRPFPTQFQAISTQIKREKRGICEVSNTVLKSSSFLPHPILS